MKFIFTIFLSLSVLLNSAFAIEHGKASIYSTACNGGTKTASGIKLVNNSNHIAHKSLKFGTKVKITNLKNGKTAEGVVVDRGPFIKGRIVDLTYGVANKIGLTKKQGITSVKVEVIGKVSLKK
jgi:rare lipoprotein A